MPESSASQRFWRLSQHGDTRNEFQGSPERAVGAHVSLAVSIGVSCEQALQLAQASPGIIGEAFLPGSSGRARVRESTYRKWYDGTSAQQERVAWDATQARMLLGELRDWATTVQLPDARNASVRRVLLQHIQTALDHGSRVYPASSRHLADEGGFSETTARRANKVLRTWGLLRIHATTGDRRKSKTATRWQLPRTVAEAQRNIDLAGGVPGGATIPRLGGPAGPVASLQTPPLGTNPESFAGHAAFRHGTGIRWDTWACIVRGESTRARDVADLLGRNLRTVRKQVVRLVEAGLVTRNDDDTLQAKIDSEQLDRLASSRGWVNGRSAAERAELQVERHARERSAHSQVVAEFAAEKEPHPGLSPVTPDGYALDRDTGELRLLVDAPRQPELVPTARRFVRKKAPDPVEPGTLFSVEHYAVTA